MTWRAGGPGQARARAGAMLLLAAASLATGSCGVGRASSDGERTGGRRAALARLVVDNRTDFRLDVAFRYAVAPGGEVVVGSVAPGARTEVAPIPAEEPILLLARANGFERRLDPRSFQIDELWVWIITTEAE